MFINRVRNTNSRFNKPIYGLSGQFTLSQGIALPYFTCNLDINRAVDELRIAEQFPASLENKWSLNELFQREIDEERIEQEIIRGYLLDPKKIKFFNAITIVLMPKDPKGGILNSFDQVGEVESPPIPWQSTDEQDAAWSEQSDLQVADFGGVQFARIGDQARLRWDEDKILAVAVDGQHRLWALRTFKEGPRYRGGTLQQVESETTIPVIFVLLDPKAGYRNDQEHAQYTIRGIARELFTDLNKNAKKVDKARELVLDDKSITALCVRTLLTGSTAEDSPDLLPLSLIRWQDDQNRFDSGYYLNSLVHLELVVNEMLDLRVPKDPMDSRQVEEFIRSINNSLGVDGEVMYHGRSLSTYYRQDHCDDEGNPQVPFARLPAQYLDSAMNGFTVKFRPWMLKLLLNFKPYTELLSYARANDLITGTFGRFVSQTSKHREAIKQEKTAVDSQWYEREIDDPSKTISGFKDNQWAYKAIFQKAMLRLGRMIEFENRGTERTLGNVDDLLRFFNRLYDEGVLKLDARLPDSTANLWTYIALNASNQKIKVARSVENRIFSLLTLWYYGSRKLELGEVQGVETESPRKLLTFFSAGSNRALYPSCNKAYEDVFEGFNNATFFNAAFGKSAETAKQARKDKAIKAHFTEVFAAGLPAWTWQTQDDDGVEGGGEDVTAVEE